MKITIKINTDNAAFDPYGDVVSDIIKEQVIPRIVDNHILTKAKLIDVNGNTVGTVFVDGYQDEVIVNGKGIKQLESLLDTVANIELIPCPNWINSCIYPKEVKNDCDVCKKLFFKSSHPCPFNFNNYNNEEMIEKIREVIDNSIEYLEMRGRYESHR